MPLGFGRLAARTEFSTIQNLRRPKHLQARGPLGKSSSTGTRSPLSHARVIAASNEVRSALFGATEAFAQQHSN